MSLYEMSAHPRTRRHSPLEIHIAVLFEGAKIRSAQGFGGDTNFEGRLVEGSYSEAGTIDADAVAEVAVI